ncbi:hypothetical protein [Nannocystis radixulma]|uniref:Uncharacterized protein n=1 Tax=Nannocystis radixulma TaxID=2995305 RepID=A0ABT5B8L3_9BACT|nr:hypothetical protein [Nannocystis radixulma]MDC0670457.1 hypothetical protein [Nannocystis radixulma]
MLTVTLVAVMFGSPAGELEESLDAVCVDAPEGACEALYALVDALERLVTCGATDAGSWCCKTCSDEASKVTCDGCSKAKDWQCGDGIKFADRPAHLDCPGKTLQVDETVTCY